MGFITEELVGVLHIYLTHLWMGEQRIGWKIRERKSVAIRPHDGEQTHTLMVLRSVMKEMPNILILKCLLVDQRQKNDKVDQICRLY